jgi:hypothetical protein
MSWRGIFAGSLALIALQVVVSSRGSADRVGSGLSWIADMVTAALDPGTPAIPDLAGYSLADVPIPDLPEWDGGWNSKGGGSGGGGGGGGSW